MTLRSHIPLALAAVLGLVMAMPTAAQDADGPAVTIEERRDTAMQACLDSGSTAEVCDCGMAYLRANLDEDDEDLVLAILGSLTTVEPAEFAEVRGMSEAELNSEILRLQPTLADLQSRCG